MVILSYIKRKWSGKIPYIYLVLRVFSFPYLDFFVQNIKERKFQNLICTAKSIAPNKVTYRLFCDCLVNWIQFQKKKSWWKHFFSKNKLYIFETKQNLIWISSTKAYRENDAFFVFDEKTFELRVKSSLESQDITSPLLNMYCLHLTHYFFQKGWRWPLLTTLCFYSFIQLMSKADWWISIVQI